MVPRKLSNSINQNPWYGKIWGRLKYFPQYIAQGSKTPPSKSGSAAAALISAGIGCFLMMVSHHLMELDSSKVSEKILLAIGSWIPGTNNPSKMWGNIGSYAGKETILLIGWLISWPILHLLWKNKNIKTKTIIFWFFILMVASTSMTWHPLFPYLPLT